VPTLLPPPCLASAVVVFYGPQGAVTSYAARRGVPRQTLYREADAVVRALDPDPHQQELAGLRQRVADLIAQCEQLHRCLAIAVVVDQDKQAAFAATGQACGVSLAAMHALLAVILGAATPCRAKLGRFSRAAGRRAGALLAVLDGHSRGRARQVAADEIFSLSCAVGPVHLWFSRGFLRSRGPGLHYKRRSGLSRSGSWSFRAANIRACSASGRATRLSTSC
jgi:hypothetical protein